MFFLKQAIFLAAWNNGGRLAVAQLKKDILE